MSVDLLKRAAAALREQAGAALHDDDPWCPEALYWGIRHLKRNVDLDLDCPAHPASSCPGPDMYGGRYVALMHPPVAVALAATMEKVAWMGALDPDLLHRVGCDELIATARAVLRE
jgi:hypothetical protein